MSAMLSKVCTRRKAILYVQCRDEVVVVERLKRSIYEEVAKIIGRATIMKRR